jgi:hypothetical protein
MVSNFRKTTQWDSDNSTYKWKIYLTNGKSFPGYSKGKDSPEISDKFKLLFRILSRLRKEQPKYPDFIYGYFTPGLVEKIELLKRTGRGLYEETLAIFYPTHYTFGGNSKFNMNKEVQEFFKAMYRELIQGKTVSHNAKKDQLYLGIGNSKSIDEKRFFSLDRSRFKTVVELDEHCAEGIRLGYTFEVMNAFRNQFSDQNFSQHGTKY